jgi:D-methionine transport system substrate-binding protein
VGVASDQQEVILKHVAEEVKKEGITLNVKTFSDYTLINQATEDGDLDLNSFQHVAFLEAWDEENDGDLVNVGFTKISPFGLYSAKSVADPTDHKISSPSDLKAGDTVGIPNDVTNGGRALQALDALGIITLKKDAPTSPQLSDIEKYNVKIEIKEIQADQIVSALPDLTAAFINTDFVLDQLKTTPKKAAIYIDTDHMENVSDLYKNIIAVREDEEDNKDIKAIVKAYQSDWTKTYYEEKTEEYVAW